MDDPIVEEVRRIRAQIQAECGYNADVYRRQLLAIEKQCGSRVVSRQPQRLEAKPTEAASAQHWAGQAGL